MTYLDNKYKKMIEYLIFDVKDNYKEDIKQDLFLKLLVLLKIKKDKIKNFDDYIFIALKNEKMTRLKQYNVIFLDIETISQKQILELFKPDINFLLELFFSHFHYFCTQLNINEKLITFWYYLKHLKISQIAEKLKTNPNNVSKILKSANQKIKNYFIKQKDHL